MQGEPALQLAILRHLRATMWRGKHKLITAVIDPERGLLP